MILVYVFGLAGAFFLALGFVVQQHVASDAPFDRRISPLFLLELVRRPLWLLGIVSMGVGNVLGALALGRGSLSLVEPLGAANLFFALPLAAAWQRLRLGWREYLGAAALVGGLAGFMAAAGPAGSKSVPVSAADWIIAGVAVIAVVAAFTWVAKRFTLGEEATLLACAAGVLFGLQDALTQRAVDDVGHGATALLTSWTPYTLLLVAIAGISLNQNAFKLAPLEASLPALTIAEPLCGVGIGAGLFAQHIRLGAPYVAIELFSLGLMVTGVILVARSPVVTGYELSKSG